MNWPTGGPANAADRSSLMPQEALALSSIVRRAMGRPSRITAAEGPLRRKSSTIIGYSVSSENSGRCRTWTSPSLIRNLRSPRMVGMVSNESPQMNSRRPPGLSRSTHLTMKNA